MNQHAPARPRTGRRRRPPGDVRAAALAALVALCGFAIPAGAQSLGSAAVEAAEKAIAGEWRMVNAHTGALQSIVRVDVRAGIAEARIVELAPDARETRCQRCSGALQGQPLVGLAIVSDLRHEGGSWSGGKILDPETGRVYDCRARLSADGKVLEVRGYLGLPAFGRTLRWERERPS